MGNSRNFNIYRRDKQRWGWLVKAAATKKIPAKPIEVAEVTITYYFPTKHRRDPDNYAGKFILDPLVNCGILLDDSFDNIASLNIVGKYDKDNPRTVIKIKACPS